ncbi:AP2 domain protein [Clostridium saccharobutylicum]|uniref:AP2 domain-containing protein n=1 Tax=Clostridium saccharobutylicum TaxID=169679 RepID=UPI0009CD25C9|nr:AP2 domain-containing protein [Clostridium saccharobutylicum]OOM17184.1 AP2 domain protein [Clostridium saccharobutylicum]
MLKENDKLGLLTLIKKESRNWRTYWYCKCDCGNEKWIRADALTRKKKPTRSCGCLSKSTQFKAEDITNKRFGKLIAIRPTNEKRQNATVWECKCDCGNTCYVAIDCLNSGKTKSCGCNQEEQRKEMRKHGLKKLRETNWIEGTSILQITNKKPLKNNKSGIRGVSRDNTREKWQAQIEFQGKHYNLGRHEKKEDAIKVRQEAEEKLFGNFLEWYEKEYKKK